MGRPRGDPAAPIGSKATDATVADTWTLNDVDLAWHGEMTNPRPKVYAAIEAAVRNATAHATRQVTGTDRSAVAAMPVIP